MNLISRICEHIKQVDKNQTYIHLRILFEGSFIKFLRVFKNLKHKHEFRNVFLFDNNRFILLSLINNPYNQIDENPPDKIQLFDPYVQYLLTIKFDDEVASIFPHDHYSVSVVHMSCCSRPVEQFGESVAVVNMLWPLFMAGYYK